MSVLTLSALLVVVIVDLWTSCGAITCAVVLNATDVLITVLYCIYTVTQRLKYHKEPQNMTSYYQ